MKKCLRAYADSEGPDQPAHPCRLIRAFAVHLQKLLDTLECINGEQRHRGDFVHAGDESESVHIALA